MGKWISSLTLMNFGYCKSGDVHATFIFVLFVVNLFATKIKACVCILYIFTCVIMEQKFKIVNKKPSEFAQN